MEKDNLVPGSCEPASATRSYRTFLPKWTRKRPNSPTFARMTASTSDIESDSQSASAQQPQASSSSSSSSAAPPSGQPLSKRLLSLLRKNLLVFLLILALTLGILLGLTLRLRDEPYSEREIMYLQFPGELLMNMLQLLILPLILSSLVSGITSLDTKSSGKLGLRAGVYYLTSMLLAAIVGIGLVLTIRPGERGDSHSVDHGAIRHVLPVDAFLDLLRQMFPDNIVEATFQKTLTKLEEKPSSSESKNAQGKNTSEPELVPVLEDVEGINMLGLVVFSLAMGIAINHVGPRGLPLKNLFNSLSEVTMVLITVVIWYSPVGVMFLVAKELVAMENLADTFQQLSFFAITVMTGLVLHGFIVLPMLFVLVCRRNPYKFIGGIVQALVTALGTSSSSATLPVTMQNLEENNEVDPRVVSFVIPVGTAINMDGTALYEAVAVIFIGQIEGLDMNIGTVIIVCLTSTAAAIGAAGVPQAGLVTLVVVLTSVGLPTDRVGLILAIDWLLDRFRTVINVLGDAIGAGIVQHLSKGDFAQMDEEGKKTPPASASATIAIAMSSEDVSLCTEAAMEKGEIPIANSAFSGPESSGEEDLDAEDKACLNAGFSNEKM